MWMEQFTTKEILLACTYSLPFVGCIIALLVACSTFRNASTLSKEERDAGIDIG